MAAGSRGRLSAGAGSSPPSRTASWRGRADWRGHGRARRPRARAATGAAGSRSEPGSCGRRSNRSRKPRRTSRWRPRWPSPRRCSRRPPGTGSGNRTARGGPAGGRRRANRPRPGPSGRAIRAGSARPRGRPTGASATPSSRMCANRAPKRRSPRLSVGAGAYAAAMAKPALAAKAAQTHPPHPLRVVDGDAAVPASGPGAAARPSHGSRSRRTTSERRSRSSASSASATCSRRSSSAAGCGRRPPRAGVPGARGGASSQRVRRDRPRGRDDRAPRPRRQPDHRPRRLRRRRRVCDRDPRPRAARRSGPTSTGSFPTAWRTGTGSSTETVRRLAARGTRLLITVDCAITAVDEVRAATTTAGVDVVVTDHHHPRPDGELPDCPIVHPAVCGYPCPELCGTGGRVQARAGARAPRACEDDIELVALATVADLMPLRGENRRLVREGLAALARTARLGLRALMAVAQRRPERARRAGPGVPARAEDQRRGQAAPRRRRARAAADRRSERGPARSPTSSTS